eukprot:588251-Prymnesium_polylepis.1
MQTTTTDLHATGDCLLDKGLLGRGSLARGFLRTYVPVVARIYCYASDVMGTDLAALHVIFVSSLYVSARGGGSPSSNERARLVAFVGSPLPAPPAGCCQHAGLLKKSHVWRSARSSGGACTRAPT